MAFIDQWNKKHGDPKRGLVLGASPTGDLSLYDRWVLSQNPKLKNKIIQHYAVRNGLKEEEAAKLQAQQAEAEKKQAYNESFVGRAKGVANKVSDVGEALYKGVASDFTTLGTGVGTAVGQSGGDVAKAQQAQTSTIDRNLKLLEQVNAQLKDPKTPGAKKIRLQKVAKMLNEQTQQLTSTQTADAQKTLDATIPSKNVGALVNVGMLASGGVLARSVGVGEGLKAAEMTGQQILRNALVGASEGAIGGVATGVQKDGYTQNDLLKSGGIGAGIGGAIPLLATGIGKEVSHFRGGNKVAAEAPQVSQEAVATITDNQHILPEHAGTGTIEPFKNLATIDARDPALAVLQKGADPKNIKRLKVVEKKIAQAQQVGGVTPDEARGLLDERTQLLESIRNPQTPIGKAISEVDTKLSTATSKQEVASLTKEKTFLQEQAVADARASSIAEDLSPSVSSTQAVDGVPVYGTGKLTPNQQSLKTEALAVKNGITEVAGDPRLTPSGSHEQWTTKVLATMNQDYEQAKKIATGLAPPPEGVPPNAFYRGVEARAIRENDGATIKALLDGPLGATSKAQGQNISALAMKDSESPLDMMKTVINARKKSNLNIPKTISNEEAQTITQLSNDLAKAREAVANGADRNLYGIAHANLYEYTNALTEAAGKKTLKEALSHPLQSAVKVAGVSKSLRATLDNSGLLRQGWKVLTTHPTTWAKNSVKSFEDLVRAFGDRNVMKEIHADVVSRPNAMNGLYKRMGIDVFGITEEAFPSSFPEKIPIFRRFYNASDAAYTGFLQRSRADLADKYLEIAQKSGVDLSSKKELQAIGKMVNSLTSRGHLGPAGEKASTVLNNVFFSPRMLKSNIDVLGGQVITGAGGSNFVRKRAALNLIKMAGSASAILTLANAVKPGSVEMNPQSANFGKIQVGDTRFDVTGGLSGLITLGSRIGPAIPGVPGDPATKSSTTGIVTKLNSGEFGAQSTADVVTNFFENKTAPAVSVIRDIMNQKDFNGNKPTVGSTIQNLIEPLIITNYQELKDNPRSANLLAGMIAEGLGVSVNTYSINSNWDQSTGKTLKAFKKGVGDRKFKEANTKYNESFNSWFDGVRKSDQFSKLGMEDRKQLITDKRTALQKDIMNSYGFQYKPMSKDEETKRLINDLKNMK